MSGRKADGTQEALPGEGKSTAEMSEEEITAIKKIAEEDMRKTKERRREIIEKAKKEPRPIRRKPYEITEEAYYRSRRQPKKLASTEKHKILLSQSPLAVILTLLLLCGLTYLLYKAILKKMK